MVIAHDGTLAYVVSDDNTAWHAEELNDQWLGAELVQRASPRDPFTQAQFRTLGWWLKAMSAKHGFDLMPANLPFHSQTTQGRRVGKSDAVPRDDTAGIAAFRSALAVFL